MFSTFFLAYPLFFHLKKGFYSDFGPSVLRLRMEESTVILLTVILQLMAYHKEKTCERAPYRSISDD